jgi:hypothetical protein
MPSKKKSNSLISLNQARRICEQSNIKVYPVNKNGFWYIQVNVGGSIKTFDKKIGSGLTLSSTKPIYNGVDWVKAIEQTIMFYAEKAFLMNNKK